MNRSKVGLVVFSAEIPRQGRLCRCEEYGPLECMSKLHVSKNSYLLERVVGSGRARAL